MRALGVIILLVFAAGCGKNPRQLVDAGNHALQAKKYSEASIDFRKALQKDPNSADAYYGLGQIFLHDGKASQAYTALNRAVELAPQNLDAKQKLANLVLAAYLADRRHPQNLYDQLNKLAGQFLARDANSYDGLRLKGYISLNDNQRPEAIGYFRQALQAKPFDPEVTVGLSKLLFQDRGTADEAEKMLLDLIQKHRDAGGAYDTLGRYYLAEKRPADAEKILKSKVAANPTQGMYVLELAEYYRRSGKTAEMKETLAGLLNDGKAFPTGRMMVGDFYNRAGDREQALKYYEEGAQAVPADKLSYQKRAVVTLVGLARRDAALALINEALGANPKDSELRMSRALIYLDQRKTDPALADLQQLDQQQKDNAMVKYQLGRALLLKGKEKEASDQWQQAIKLQPSFEEPRIALATSALQNRKFDEVLRLANEILAATPNHTGAQLLRADALRGMGRQGEAKTLMTDLREKSPSNPVVDVEYAFLALSENKPAEAEKIFRAHYAPGQTNLRPLTGLVESLMMQKRNEDAIHVLQGDLAKLPGRMEVQTMLANAFAISGEVDSAVKTMEELAAAHPENADIRLRLGQLQALKGDLQSAIVNFQKARGLAPQSPAPVLSLAEAEERLGQSDTARQDYQSVLKLDPANLVALNNLAYITADRGGNLDDALHMIMTASQRVPKQPNFTDTLGYIYLKQKKVDSALRVFSDLAQHYPANATFRFHHALALLESGSKEQARKELQAALADKPAADLASKIKQALSGIS